MKSVPQQPCVLLKYGELALKGRNKQVFEHRLRENVRRGMAGVGAPVRLRSRRGVLVLSAPEEQAALVERARRVMGVSLVQPALRAERSYEGAVAAALELARSRHRSSAPPTFAVRARRRDKRFPLRSGELATGLGSRIRAELGWPVDLDSPEVEISVEVDRHEVFVATERFPGQGGLPVGSSGRALVLLSGGFDSPVAAYRAMRRGLRCDFVHFTGAPLTGPSSTYKAYALARQLGAFQAGARLHVIALGAAQRALAAAGAGDLQIVAQRRLMARAAERLARRCRAQALVTGDSLGQVSSQTLRNLTAVDEAVTLPVLRPLLGWDKTEIMAEAARIETAPISRLPDEDCCALLVPPRVTTRASAAELAELERRIDLERTLDRLLPNAQLFRAEVEHDGRGSGGT